ncbi:hypothetical protein Q1695_006857 [Nippostrongylus brasiliensis]|nr:hypothetical protein Q1695_006857 [Nippostrongylus brasiliensis]
MAPVGKMSVLMFAFFVAYNVRTASGTNIIGPCSDRDGMNDSIRKAFVSAHNKYRSLVAKGQASGRYGTAPQAARMLKMVYDCNIEKTAMEHTKRCRFEHSPRSSRPNLGENVYVQWGMKSTFKQAAKSSCDNWFSELKSPGMPQNNILTMELFNRPQPIGHYTQMVWQNSYRLGCGVANCPDSRTLVTCQYGPAGNILNQPVYEIGRPCQTNADCKCKGCKCNRKNALCVMPLSKV